LEFRFSLVELMCVRQLTGLQHKQHRKNALLNHTYSAHEDSRKDELIAGYLAEVRRLQAFIGAAYAVLKCNTTYDHFRG